MITQPLADEGPRRRFVYGLRKMRRCIRQGDSPFVLFGWQSRETKGAVPASYAPRGRAAALLGTMACAQGYRPMVRTAVFGAVNEGSNPSTPAILERIARRAACLPGDFAWIGACRPARAPQNGGCAAPVFAPCRTSAKNRRISPQIARCAARHQKRPRTSPDLRGGCAGPGVSSAS